MKIFGSCIDSFNFLYLFKDEMFEKIVSKSSMRSSDGIITSLYSHSLAESNVAKKSFASAISFFGPLPLAIYSNERVIIFLAKDLVKTHRHLDETEDIEVVKVPIEEAKEMLDKDGILTSSEEIALLHYFLYEHNK